MARIYPDPKYADTGASAAERDLLHAFAKQLGKEWTLLHSVSWATTQNRTLRLGECDFFAMHPDHGWIVIEAKTGHITPDYTTNTWKCSNGTSIHNPVEQAKRSMYRFRGLFAEKIPSFAHVQPPSAFAVALPHTDRLPRQMPSDADPGIFILRGDMDRLERRLINIIKLAPGYAANNKCTPAEFAKMEECLLPQFHIVPSLAHQIDAERKSMIQLTEQQSFFLLCCSAAPKLLIIGPSGTGKTLVAMEEAKQFATEGKRILLLCYNRTLANFLAAQAKNIPQIKVNTFHGFAEEVIRHAGMEYRIPEAREEWPNFFDKQVPVMLVDALSAFDEKYDAVLVDEAQDFSEDWWDSLEFVIDHTNAAKVHAFGDARQNLYSRQSKFFFETPVITLPLNCRNTQSIAAWISKKTGIQTVTNSWCPAGEPPQEIAVADDAAERDSIRKILHQLLITDKVPAESVVILGCRQFGKSIFAGHEDLAFCRIRSIAAAADDTAKPKDARPVVRYSTIQSFKGLESDFVILTRIDKDNPHIDANTLLYVGASRACLRLCVHVLSESPTT